HHGVGLEARRLGLDVGFDVLAAGLLLAFEKELHVHGQLAGGLQQAFHGLHLNIDLPFVVAGTAAVDVVAADFGLERRRFPLVERIGRLHVVVAIEEDGGLVGGAEPLGVDQRVAVARVFDQLGGGHAGGQQIVQCELGGAPDVGLVFRQRADGGNAEEGLQALQEFALVFLIVVHEFSLSENGGGLHDGGGRRRLVRIARVGQRNTDQGERYQRHHEDAHQVRRVLEERGQFAVFVIKPADHEAGQGFAGDQAAGDQDADVFHAGALRFVEGTALANGVHDPADHAADEDGTGGADGQVHSDGHQHGAAHFEHDHGDAHQDAGDHQRPRHIAAHDALGERGHQSGLRGRKFLIAETDTAFMDVADVQPEQREVHHATGQHDSDELGDLDGARCAAQDVADLEILEEFARDGRRDTPHGGYGEYRYDAGGPGDA